MIELQLRLSNSQTIILMANHLAIQFITKYVLYLLGHSLVVAFCYVDLAVEKLSARNKEQTLTLNYILPFEMIMMVK